MGNIGANLSTHPRTQISTLQFAIHIVPFSKISGVGSNKFRVNAYQPRYGKHRWQSVNASAHSDQHLAVRYTSSSSL